MTPRPSFKLLYAPQVQQHLRAIERKYHALIRREIETQLQFEPDVETRNRKPLRPMAGSEAAWEIRFGPGNRFRVFYEVDRKEGVVYILAIGVKERERLCIGGEEIAL